MSVILSRMYSSLFIAVLMCICIRGGYDAVHQYFEEGHVCCWRPAIIWVIDLISSCCESRSMGFSLVWFHITAEASVSDVLSPVVRDLILSDEFDCVCAFDSSVLQSIC